MTEMELKKRFEYEWKQQHPIWIIVHIVLLCVSCLFAIVALVSFFKGDPVAGFVYAAFFLAFEIAASAMSGAKGAHWIKYKNEHLNTSQN